MGKTEFLQESKTTRINPVSKAKLPGLLNAILRLYVPAMPFVESIRLMSITLVEASKVNERKPTFDPAFVRMRSGLPQTARGGPS